MEVRIVAATLLALAAEERSGAEVAHVLDVAPPAEWPPQFNNAATRAHFRELINAHPGEERWLSAYIVAVLEGVPTLAGTAGFKGPPRNGSVEIGYAVVAPYQRRGIAAAAVRALLVTAFADSRVTAVRAETLPSLIASRGVLAASGFAEIGRRHDPEDGEIIIYAIGRHPEPRDNSQAQPTG